MKIGPDSTRSITPRGSQPPGALFPAPWRPDARGSASPGSPGCQRRAPAPGSAESAQKSRPAARKQREARPNVPEAAQHDPRTRRGALRDIALRGLTALTQLGRPLRVVPTRLAIRLLLLRLCLLHDETAARILLTRIRAPPSRISPQQGNRATSRPIAPAGRHAAPRGPTLSQQQARSSRSNPGKRRTTATECNPLSFRKASFLHAHLSASAYP